MYIKCAHGLLRAFLSAALSLLITISAIRTNMPSNTTPEVLLKKKNYAYQICFYWHRHFPVNVMLDNRTSNVIEKQSIFLGCSYLPDNFRWFRSTSSSSLIEVNFNLLKVVNFYCNMHQNYRHISPFSDFVI